MDKPTVLNMNCDIISDCRMSTESSGGVSCPRALLVANVLGNINVLIRLVDDFVSEKLFDDVFQRNNANRLQTEQQVGGEAALE